MIIKFKSRKNIYSAKQLVNYILTDKGRIKNPFEAPIILQNINRLDLKTMHKDFLENYKYLSKRKNGVAFYHTILAISKKDKDKITKPMLKDLMEKYIEFRGIQNALVIAKSHDNQHIHLMISANNLRSKERLRMSHQQMKKLLNDFESYHKGKFPELENSIIHTIKKRQISRDITKENRNHRKEKEYQLKLRIGDKKTQKELVADMVNDLMQKVGKFSEFTQQIQKTKDLKIYTYRGKIRGILYLERKYRFSTLQVPKEKILQLEKVQERLKQLSLIKEMHKGTREMELGR